MEHEIVRSVAAAQEEIMAFAQELGQYGLRMTDISENCPKQERTLAVCHRVLSCAREYPAYLEQLIMKHSGGFEPFTKVTAPLGSIAQACRFKSCRAHQNWEQPMIQKQSSKSGGCFCIWPGNH